MRPVVVVVTLASRQDPAEVGQVPDKGPVEKLTAASADPSLHDRVHAGHPYAAAHDPQACRGEHRVEAFMEDGVAVVHTNLTSAPA